ncbi:MAG: hypothetical protein AB9836_11135 [Aminipila sp.]
MNVDELRKSNSRLEENLSESENKDMIKIVAYLRGSRLSDMDQELVRQDILDIVLSAKERGEEMSQAIGTDYKQFCDDIIAEIKPKSIKDKVKDTLSMVSMSVSILIFIKMIFFSAELIKRVILKQSINLNVPIQYLDILSMVVIVAASWAIVEVILRDAFDEKDRRTKIMVAIIFVALIVSFTLLYALRIGTGTVFEINLIAGYCLAALLFVISKIKDKRKK